MTSTTNLCPVCQTPIRKNARLCTLHRAMEAMDISRQAVAKYTALQEKSRAARILFALREKEARLQQDPAIARENLKSIGIKKPTQTQINRELDRMHKADQDAKKSYILKAALKAIVFLALLDTAQVNPIIRQAKAVLEMRVL